MELERFAALRPYFYHITSRDNLASICASRTLEPASALMERAGRVELLRQRRRSHVRIEVDGRDVFLRDHRPLHPGNIALHPGWTFGDLVESLNRRVFFWPGTASTAIAHGLRYFDRYYAERPLVLRVARRSLIARNMQVESHYSRHNSGSPRCTAGRRSPRGPDLFQDVDTFQGVVSDVVEVTFDAPLRLPPDTEVGEAPDGSWRTLFA
jgi:hypothetical protein